INAPWSSASCRVRGHGAHPRRRRGGSCGGGDPSCLRLGACRIRAHVHTSRRCLRRGCARTRTPSSLVGQVRGSSSRSLQGTALASGLNGFGVELEAKTVRETRQVVEQPLSSKPSWRSGSESRSTNLVGSELSFSATSHSAR